MTFKVEAKASMESISYFCKRPRATKWHFARWTTPYSFVFHLDAHSPLVTFQSGASKYLAIVAEGRLTRVPHNRRICRDIIKVATELKLRFELLEEVVFIVGG